MASNSLFRSTLTTLTTTNATSLLNPTITSLAGTTGLSLVAPYLIVRKIRIVNRSASPATVSLFLGAAATATAGTEFAFAATSVPANSFLEWVGILRMGAADFLCGGSGTATVLTFEAEGEIGFGT